MATASKITSVATEVHYGQPCGIGWSSSSSSYTHTVVYKIGEFTHTENVAAGITSNNILIRDELGRNIIEQIPTKSGTMSITLHTYNGSKKVGSTGTSAKIVVDVQGEGFDFRPVTDSFVVTPSVISENILNTFGNVYIKGFTKPIFEISGRDNSGSAVKSYIVKDSFSSQTYNIGIDELPYTGDIVNQSGEIFYYAQTKSNRNFTSDALQVSINVQDYYSPIVNSFTAKRQEANSTSVTISFNCTYAQIFNSSGISKNKATATLEYKAEKSAEWISCGNCDIGSATDDTITITDSFDESLSYNFRLTVTDLIGEPTVSTAFLPRYEILLHYPKNQKGFAIGKYVENGNFEVGLESEFFENVSMKQNLNIDGIVSGENFGRFVYVGKDNCVKSENAEMGNFLSSAGSYDIRIYIVKPFNFAYFRLYVYHPQVVTADKSNYRTLFTLREEFKPAWVTPLAVCGGQNCDLMIDKNGNIQILAYNEISNSARIFASGFYPLNGGSPLYVQNFSKTATLN